MRRFVRNSVLLALFVGAGIVCILVARSDQTVATVATHSRPSQPANQASEGAFDRARNSSEDIKSNTDGNSDGHLRTAREDNPRAREEEIREKKYGLRENRHLGIRGRSRSREETATAIERLFTLQGKDELLAALRELYRSPHLDKVLTDRLLDLFDATGDFEKRDGILDALLYSQEESYVTAKIVDRLGASAISDSTYWILSCFPDKEAVLGYLITRFEAAPIDSPRAAIAIHAIMWDLPGSFRSHLLVPKLIGVLKTQIPQVEKEEIRAKLLDTILATSNRDATAFLDWWFPQERSETARIAVLRALQHCHSNSTGSWATEFLKRIIREGKSPKEVEAAQETLRRLNPPER